MTKAPDTPTYELRWSDEFFLLETHWEKGKDGKGCGSPRGSSGFHPAECATQVMPFLFDQFPKGTLILAPRRYHFATSYSWRNYAAQGHDGLWPNYAVAARFGQEFVKTGQPVARSSIRTPFPTAGQSTASTTNHTRGLGPESLIPTRIGS
jgi:hypothetical protein